MSNLNQDRLHNRENRIFALYKWYLFKAGENVIEFGESDLEIEPGSEPFTTEQKVFIKTIIEEYEDLEKEIIKYIPDTWKWDRFIINEKAVLLNAAAELLLANNKKAIVIDSSLLFAKRYSGLESQKMIHAIIDKIGN